MGKLIITHGLPGSGKTTWAKSLKDVIIIERDQIREELYGKKYHNHQDIEKEKIITKIQDSRIKEALNNNKIVVSSDTNLNPFTVARLVKLSKGHDLEHKDFNVPIKECLKNNNNRTRKVDEKIILKMAEKTYKNGNLLKVRANLNGYGFILDPNTKGSKILEKYSKILENKYGLIEDEIIIVDIDGTLAKNNSDFDKYISNSDDGKKHWNDFFKNIKNAEPNLKVIEKANFLQEKTGAKIVILTGRSDKYSEEIIDFINKTQIKASVIFAKPEGDYRKSKEYKTEKIKELNKTIIVAFDDEKTSIEVFHNLGIPVYKVDKEYNLNPPFSYHIEDDEIKKCNIFLYSCGKGKHFETKIEALNYINKNRIEEINLNPVVFVEKENNIYLPNSFREKLFKAIKQGYVKPSFSSDGELIMLKYTSKAVYERFWNDVTINCRGLLVDKNYEKVFARGFCKFFNFNEYKVIKKLPLLDLKEKVIVSKKMDGSLGLVVVIDGQIKVFTAGSALENDITKKAKEILHKTFPMFKPEKNYTYCFEIISKVNPIVVDYFGEEKIVLIGIIDNKTGKTLPINLWENKYLGEKTQIVARDVSLQEALKIPIPYDEEGYVFEFKNGMKVKVKGKDYLVIHKLINSISVKNLGEMIINNQYYKLEEEVKNISSSRGISILNKAVISLDKIVEKEIFVFKKEIEELLKPLNIDIDYLVFNDREVRKNIIKILKVSPNFHMLIKILENQQENIRKNVIKEYIKDKSEISIMSLVSFEKEKVGDVLDDYTK